MVAFGWYNGASLVGTDTTGARLASSTYRPAPYQIGHRVKPEPKITHVRGQKDCMRGQMSTRTDHTLAGDGADHGARRVRCERGGARQDVPGEELGA
eukprot:229151-Rhodomonas_salina.1